MAGQPVHVGAMIAAHPRGQAGAIRQIGSPAYYHYGDYAAPRLKMHTADNRGPSTAWQLYAAEPHALNLGAK